MRTDVAFPSAGLELAEHLYTRNGDEGVSPRVSAVPATDSPARLAAVHSISPLRPASYAARSPAVRAVIADGQNLVRAGFRLLLESTAHVTVVGEAANGEEAVALTRRHSPDVALMDARLPGLDSVAATRQISSESGVKVMLLAASGPDERILAALRAGATGLLLNELTAREREVVALVGHGLDNAEIAERLVVSLATAKTHVSRAMLKLGAHDRAKLVVFAYETGLVRTRTQQAPHPDLLLNRAPERHGDRPAENASQQVSTSEQLGLARTRV